MSQSLAIIEPQEPRGLSIGQMTEISDVFVKSGFFADLKSQAQAVVKMMAGQELGLEPFSAMAELHVIQGKITMSAGLLAKKVKQSGRYNYRVTEHTDKVCAIEFYENGEPCGVSTFTIEDAKRAQVKNLDKYPKNMLFARAISNGVRFYCPDVTGSVGAYVDGEIEEAAPQPLRATNSPEAHAQTIEVEAVPQLDESYIKAITELARITGTDIQQQLKKARVESLADLPQERADKLIAWLEQKAEAMNQPSAEETVG